VRAGVLIDGPIINRLLGRPLALGARDRDLNFGDPLATAALGWHSGNWHWKLGAAVSIPAGAYEPSELSNVAFNRWIGDFTAAATYLDPALGIDLSAVDGFRGEWREPVHRLSIRQRPPPRYLGHEVPNQGSLSGLHTLLSEQLCRTKERSGTLVSAKSSRA
jgi:Putative MetA-pathway of phenol degradation